MMCISSLGVNGGWKHHLKKKKVNSEPISPDPVKMKSQPILPECFLEENNVESHLGLGLTNSEFLLKETERSSYSLEGPSNPE